MKNSFQVLMQDVLRPYVPEYKGQVTSEDGERILFSIEQFSLYLFPIP